MSSKFFPSPEAIRFFYQKGYAVPLALSCPYRDPFEIYARFYGQEPSVFLDSPKGHPRTASHSFICLRPFEIFRLSDAANDPILKLRRYFAQWKGRMWKEFPHFTGGGVGFLSYDFLSGRASTVPKVFLLMTRDVMVFDHEKRQMKIMTSLLPEKDGVFETAYRAACRRIEEIREKAAAPWTESPNGHLSVKGRLRSASPPPARGSRPRAGTAPETPGMPGVSSAVSRFQSNFSRRDFRKMVLKAKAYIRAGDIYQANLSQKFSFDFEGDPLKLYKRLRTINPSPFSAFLDFGDLKVVSSSPERLIKLTGRHCETRPIAGTRPAGRNFRESRKFSAELLLSEKERAEHLMLLDLERNDLGRVCEYKSVRVDEMMTLERYSHVMHIVSNVVGRLAKDKDRFDLLEAVFPGGTITGCPKIRCMEIIEELEGAARGLYTGSIGYFDFNGNMDWNIVIRTLVLEGKKAFLQSGAGIVYDSCPEKEYEETLHKARVFLEALEIKNESHAFSDACV